MATGAAIPSAAVQWQLPLLRQFLTTGGFAPIHQLSAGQSLAGVTIPDYVWRAPVMEFEIRGTTVAAFTLGDPIAATRAAASVRSQNPRAIVFTSNNLLVVAPESSSVMRELQDSLTSRQARSARE
jgi:hypothetical protein